jgi:hypothetical protein
MRPLAVALAIAAALLGGCRLSLWSWTSGSGTHELSIPPPAATTPEPTPESRY